MIRNMMRQLLLSTGVTYAALDDPISVHIDAQSADRVYDGHGALSAGANSRLLFDYPEPQREQILDYLFKPGFGANLHHLKVEIGGDTWSTDGSEPSHMHSRGDLNFDRGWEFWLLKEAKKRNPDIVTAALSWGTPGWVGEGEFYSEDNIYNYTIPFLDGARDHHNISLDYIGVWNERYITNLEYPKQLRRALDRSGYADMKIIASDNAQGAATSDMEDAMALDPELNASIDVIGLHYPRGNPEPKALALGKTLWASESLTTSADWIGTALWARTLNQNFVRMNATTAIAWSLIWSVYPSLICYDHGLMDAYEPWSGHYKVAQQIWATAHTTLFTKPGWMYAPQGRGAGLFADGAGSYVSFVDNAASPTQLTIVVEFMDGGGGALDTAVLAFNVSLSIASSSRWALSLWATNRSVSMMALPAVSVSADGVALLSVKRWHQYTLTTVEVNPQGLGGGNAIRDGSGEAPLAAAMPLPHSDNFEASRLEAPGLYFNDQEGTFSVFDDHGNKVLRQQTEYAPIRWGDVGDPSTVIGAFYQNYRAQISARIVSGGVRVDRKDVVMADCTDNAAAQTWERRADGTIRPGIDSSRCLASRGGRNGGLFTEPCAEGVATQQWVYGSAEFPGHLQWLGTHDCHESQGHPCHDTPMCVDFNQQSLGLDLWDCCVKDCCVDCETFSMQDSQWRDGGIAGGTKCPMESEKSKQYVGLCGRLGDPNSGGFGFGLAGSVCLTVHSTGRWTLETNSTELQSGQLELPVIDAWLSLSLTFERDVVSGSIHAPGGQPTEFEQQLPAGSTDHGLVALISGRHLADFDDFSLEEAPGHPAQPVQALAHSVFHAAGRRTDFTGEVGIALEARTAPATVTAIGRFRCTSDGARHDLSIVRASDGEVLARATVDMSTASLDAAGFAYTSLDAALVLPAGEELYYLVSSEQEGGDCWYGEYSDSCGGMSGGLPIYFTGSRGPLFPRGSVYREHGGAWTLDHDAQWSKETRRAYGPVNLLMGDGSVAVFV